MSGGGLTAQSLRPDRSFNWSVRTWNDCNSDPKLIQTLFFLFYFNRLFATLISYGVRAYTWHKYRVYIDIQALQVSLLGGRVFFKGLRYHGLNETILVQGGHITWRYWLRNVKEGDYSRRDNVLIEPGSIGEQDAEKCQEEHKAGSGEKGGVKGPNDLPCRIYISLRGLEWFIYNRSPAYDAIVASMSGGVDTCSKCEPEPGMHRDSSGGLDATPTPDVPTQDHTHSRKNASTSHGSSESRYRTQKGLSVSEKIQSSGSSIAELEHKTVEKSGSLDESPSLASTTEARSATERKESGAPDSQLLRILPIHIECTKGAIVMGNENTKSVLTAHFEKADGEIEAKQSRPADQYKQLINFDFTHPVIQMRPNPDYKETQIAGAARLKNVEDTDSGRKAARHYNWHYHHQKRKVWHSIRDLVPLFQKSVESFAPSLQGKSTDRARSVSQSAEARPDHWLGLTRYLDEAEQEEQDGWPSIEYAKLSTVVDCPRLSMSFFWDVPGIIPPRSADDALDANTKHDINCDIPPEWGIDLSVQGGIINYGPWTDRQRGELQAVFFPTLYKDATPATRLIPGESRVSTVFKLFVELSESTILRIPSREESKDWKWIGRAEAVRGAGIRKGEKEHHKKKHGKRRKVDKGVPSSDVRPFGWLDIKVTSNSTVSYTMDMVAGKHGFKNTLNVDFQGTEITSSVNHCLLWRSDALTISCDLSNPLQWNALHTWNFNIGMHDLELFLLRDHIFLLTDLVTDWSTGPPADFYTFTPFKYFLNVQAKDFKLYLNVNDSNIINNAADFEDNTFINIWGEHLVADVGIPLDKYRPTQNEISFDVDARDGGLRLHTPPWNTQYTFLDISDVASLKDLELTGRYNYYNATLPGITDTAIMNLHGKTLSVNLHGFLIRYLMNIKDNYFGDDMHFRTLEEFQNPQIDSGADLDGPSHQNQYLKKSNDLDVILSISAEDSAALLPANLYSCKESIRIEIASLAADLRFTNYYMDLEANFSPLSFSLSNAVSDGGTPIFATSSTQLFIDGIDLYGHRLFGLPPAEPTYVCNWDFTIGAVTGECSCEFLKKLVFATRAFAFNNDDEENALPSTDAAVINDIVFLRAKVQSIQVWLHAGEAAFLLGADSMKVNFNDWAGTNDSERLSLIMPDLVIACVDAESASRHRSRLHPAVQTHAYFKTTVELNMVERKLGFSEERTKQQTHIRSHDQRTERTDFLLHDEDIGDVSATRPVQADAGPPAMPFPPMPEPIMCHDLISKQYTRQSHDSPDHAGSRKSSFLSFAASTNSDNSDNRSVIRTKSARSRSFRSASGSLGMVSVPSMVHHSMSRNNEQAHRNSILSTRQPSFQSPLGESERERAGLPPSSVAFSSAFTSPYFPLHAVEPDLRDVPVLPKNLNKEADTENFLLPSNGILSSTADDDAVHTSFMVNLSSGIRAFCSPKALYSVASLLHDLQPREPTDVLDTFQIGVMGEIFNFAKRKVMTGKTIDTSLRIPYTHARFVNSYAVGPEYNAKHEEDQYNAVLSRFAVTTRAKLSSQEKGSVEGGDELQALHFILDSLNFSAKERSGASLSHHAAIRADVGDIVFWLVSEKTLSANIQFRGFEAATASKRIEYLASLIHRTTILVEKMDKVFAAVGVEQQQRLRHFAFSLTMAGGDVADPSFLTRPSYVLRSATDHIRSNDSWKIVSRFRYIYQSLNKSSKDNLIIQCMDNTGRCPNDAESMVLSSFDHWRSWDLAHVKKSYAMKKLYGSMAGIEELHPQKTVPIKAVIKTGGMKLVLDPGPKQNEISIEAVVIGVAVNVPLVTADAIPIGISSSAHSTVIQIHCGRIAIRLHWEVCELVEDMLKLYNSSESKVDSETEFLPLKRQTTNSDHHYHIVIKTDSGAITLDSINLKHISVTKELKVSVVVTDRRGENKGILSSVIVNAIAGSSEIISRQSRVLLMSKLRYPSIYVSYDGQILDGTPVNVWRLAGTSRELSWQIPEEVLGIIEVVDMVISDEVRYIFNMIQNQPGHEPSATSLIASQGRKPINRVNVALFLESYNISIALLQSLNYVISGTIARISVAPRQDSEMAFDFDLKENTHGVQTQVLSEIRTISVLSMPPVNGRVTSRRTEAENTIVVVAIVESIILDAAALHGLLDTLNRPEMNKALEDVRSDSTVIQSHLEDIFGPPAIDHPQKPSQSSQLFVYDVYISIAGLGVHATAASPSPGASSASLDFNFGAVQVKAANRLEQAGPVLEFPEIHAVLRHISLNLTRSEHNCTSTQQCGSVSFDATIKCTSKQAASGVLVRAYHVMSDGLEINLFAETASTIVDVIVHLQNRMKDLVLPQEVRNLRRLRQAKPRISISDADVENTSTKSEGSDQTSSNLFNSMYSLEMDRIQVSWIVGGSVLTSPGRETQDLVLSIKKIDLSTRKENAARLIIQDFQLQMVPVSHDKNERTLNSALLPEVVFNVAYLSANEDRRLAFQAVGKSLDLRLTSQFILPATEVQRSIATASGNLRAASANWRASPTQEAGGRKKLLGNKRLASLLVDADFAGAVVYVQGRKVVDRHNSIHSVLRGGRIPQHGRYGQFTHEDASSSTTLRAPGIAFKLEYKDNGKHDPSLNAEIKVDASSNILYPTVVPLVMEISSSVKEIVREPSEDDKPPDPKPSTQKFLDEDTLRNADPSAIFGRCKLNLGLRICKQEFSLSCQPIARVAATARFEDIYITVNTVQSNEHDHFFAISMAFTRLQASVQHVYSRESTGSFNVDSIVLSLMNSKHLSGVSGVSAILKISPMKALINAKQLQDFLLFREIWVPPEIRLSSPSTSPPPAAESQTYLVQRYQQVAAAGAFPWNATVAIAELDIGLDLGQALGKSSLIISDFWVSSKKSSDWEQNLCLGFNKIGINSTGRMSGFIQLHNFKVRTTIQWPSREKALDQTPLIQASLGFGQLRVKASFDYQAFLIADVTTFEFIMYNVRNREEARGDRLVATLDGGRVQVFCTTASSSQGIALYQAFLRLVQEKEAAYEASLKDIEKFLRRKSVFNPMMSRPSVSERPKQNDDIDKAPISLHTDVVVTLRALNIGAFPSTFLDHQIFKVEALGAEARFAVILKDGKIESGLGLNLGQLQIALAAVKRPNVPKSLGELSVDDVVNSAIGARGGTILRVPKVMATMQTWQTPQSSQIDYIFKSSFTGKVDVGWNYSRISFIRGMWTTHYRALAHKLGKPLPQQSTVKITGGPQAESDGKERKPSERQQEKITAVVNVPQSKYEYHPLEAPIIETPQLRDMGEATPPLEWIGLHRERLPNLTHQIVIVTLLEVAKEVEDAYLRILGSS
ncbi:MAG: hypothetical protein M1827_005251 [Pycnora praestabilis]|nr:MAG: hypothetical protein M1827_005251 [Pycnora praestabilis]